MSKLLLSVAFCAVAAVVGLSDCAAVSALTGANDTALKATEYVCTSATALLKAAIAVQPRISVENQGHITHAVAIINPVCSQEKVPTLTSTAKASLDSALAELTAAVPAP